MPQRPQTPHAPPQPLEPSIRVVAVHEAGHYIVGLLLGAPVQGAHVESIERSGVSTPAGWYRTARPAIVATYSLGGYASERFIEKAYGIRHRGDDDTAYSALYGSKPATPLPTDWFLMESHPEAKAAYQHAEQIVSEQTTGIEVVASALLANPGRFLDTEALQDLLGPLGYIRRG